MIVETIPVGPLEANCYIAIAEQTRAGVIVDPGEDAELILHVVKTRRARIEWILLTHAHYDHVGALGEIRKGLLAPVAIHSAELANLREEDRAVLSSGFRIEQPEESDKLFQGGEIIKGSGYTVRVIHTPGHTPGSSCFHVDNLLFSGDTLFAGSIGATNFPGSSYGELIHSIKTNILSLPDDTQILPGHGPATTVADEKLLNPFL